MASQNEAKSRLPRPHSSPDGGTSLKRKATDDDLVAGPSKARAMMDSAGSALPRTNPVHVTTRTGIAAAPPQRPVKPLKSSTTARQPLTNSNSIGRGTRAGSAPATGKPVLGIVGGRRTPEPGMARSTTRTVSGSSAGGFGRMPPVEEERLGQIQQSLDNLASMIGVENSKVAGLEAFRSKVETELTSAKNMQSDTRRGMIAAADELDDLKRRYDREMAEVHSENARKDREIAELREALQDKTDDLSREKNTVRTLKDNLASEAASQLQLQAQITALTSRCDSLSSEGQSAITSRAQLQLDYNDAQARIEELELELQEAEALRRKLHNQVQELKGNIRVFCRVRPALPHERDNSEGLAAMNFPDKREHREIVVSNTTETATGATRDATMPFAFDRVFEPGSSQMEVFEEISHLVQSCIDGYNVCIFAYGQTGSGKSFTMEGGPSSDSRGMIPRAVRHVFKVSEDLQKKGWEYKMEGQFLEIYNETIVDLLGKSNDGKHEIKHEKGGRTNVTDVVVYPLNNPDQVQNLLSLAQSRRTVHATLMNERSSRSHSVFTLRITGTNSATGETSDGSLNLVDLAGSERLKESGAGNDKDRLKETQAINKSLSALGDVIAALGERGASGDKHIPYRNSKLTYLLQNSLSGNSKTLMFVNVSPLATHLGESICSLRFATKVNNTTLGTARKQQARPS